MERPLNRLVTPVALGLITAQIVCLAANPETRHRAPATALNVLLILLLGPPILVGALWLACHILLWSTGTTCP